MISEKSFLDQKGFTEFMKKKLFIYIILGYAIWATCAMPEFEKTLSRKQSFPCLEYKKGDEVLASKLRKMSSQELMLLQQELSIEKQKYFCLILKEYLCSNLDFHIKNKDYVKIIESIEFACSLSYLSGMTYLFQEKIIRLAYKVFNMPDISENNKKHLLSVLKRKIILPTKENFRETVTDSYGTKIIFYANRLLYNYFCITVMEISLKNMNPEKENYFFSLKIKNISEKLLLKNSKYCVIQQDGINGFYWVIKQPSGFLYANKNIAVYMLESNQIIQKSQSQGSKTLVSPPPQSNRYKK